MTRRRGLKFGGELLETPGGLARLAQAVAHLTADGGLVLVHGGGGAIDAELARRGAQPQKVDGLRITDPTTLDVVVKVLAGSANTALVAALVTAGVRAVGLTGVDAGLGRANRARPHVSTTGTVVDLGLVGDPTEPDAALLETLLAHGYVPVVASLGLDAETGAVLNVNADVMACRLAAALHAAELVIAGTTAGVLDPAGATLAWLDPDGIARLIGDGTASAGMVAKLSACRVALAAGVASIRLVDGRALTGTQPLGEVAGTTLVPATQTLGV